MNGATCEGMGRRVLDTNKIEALMRWKPTIPLDQTLDEVIEEVRDGRAW